MNRSSTTLLPLNVTNTLTERRLLARAAWLYYVEGLTQDTIARRLDLSRVKVNRLISQARREGIVQISIKLPEMTFPEMEEILCGRFNLQEVVVMMESEPGEALYRVLAQGAADWLAPRLAPDMIVGVSKGRTLSFLPLVFKPIRLTPCTFVEVVGGVSEIDGSFAAYDILGKMAELVGGRPLYLHVPTVVSSESLRQTILNERSVAMAFEFARNCHILLASVGSIDNSALLYTHGYLNQADLDDLRQRGAVGDILGHFIDETGEPVHCFLDERMLAIHLSDLKKIPYRVAVAGGAEKAATIKAALSAGYFNVLITDIKTAQMISG